MKFGPQERAIPFSLPSPPPPPSSRKRRIQTIRPRPHYTGEIWKPALSIRHENRAFRKRSSNQRNLKTPALHFSLDWKHFENGAFRKWSHRDNHLISLCPSFPERKSKMTGGRRHFFFFLLFIFIFILLQKVTILKILEKTEDIFELLRRCMDRV